MYANIDEYQRGQSSSVSPRGYCSSASTPHSSGGGSYGGGGGGGGGGVVGGGSGGGGGGGGGGVNGYGSNLGLSSSSSASVFNSTSSMFIM